VIVELSAAKASKREQKARWIFYQKTPTYYQWTTKNLTPLQNQKNLYNSEIKLFLVTIQPTKISRLMLI
jgi:hypothetical protein